MDAEIYLVKYHEPGTDPKPAPQQTDSLPLRTRLIINIFSDIHNAQTHAYYEEIDTIPAALLCQKSEFKAGHSYVVHPLLSRDLRDVSTLALRHLQKWIETDCPSDLFVSPTRQVLDFKKVRSETLEATKKLLKLRESRGEIGKQDDVVGSWELVDSHAETTGMQTHGETNMVGFEERERKSWTGRHTDAALEEAAEAGRRAAEEARIRDEYEFIG